MFTSHPDFNGHKFVSFIHDQDTGLRGFIAIHNDILGPAMGGTRMYPYASEEDALTDVLRLSRGMTYKSALAGLKYGGAKAVLIGDPKHDKTEDLLHAYAQRINYLNGAFITGEDVNISVADIETVAQVSPYVAGRSEGVHGGRKGGGDPSPVTARGVVYGIQACLQVLFGSAGIAGRSFAIQGVGKVGFRLARLLHEQRARIIIADSDDSMVQRALSEFSGTSAVHHEEIHTQEVDIFVPCAMGGVLNASTIPQLRCKAVAGSSNNQLATLACGDDLFARDILYAPDYVINAGGLISVTEELDPRGYDAARVQRNVVRIYGTLKNIFSRSAREGLAPHRISEKMAQEILAHAEVGKKLLPGS